MAHGLQDLAFMNEVKDILHKERIIQEANESKAARLSELREKRSTGSAGSSTLRDGPFFILSVDGGGLRGIINCVLLQRLCEVRTGMQWRDCADPEAILSTSQRCLVQLPMILAASSMRSPTYRDH